MRAIGSRRLGHKPRVQYSLLPQHAQRPRRCLLFACTNARYLACLVFMPAQSSVVRSYSQLNTNSVSGRFSDYRRLVQRSAIAPPMVDEKGPPIMRTQATRPDTLNLASRAEAAIHALRALGDETMNGQIYFFVRYDQDPPTAYHDAWDYGDGTGRRDHYLRRQAPEVEQLWHLPDREVASL